MKKVRFESPVKPAKLSTMHESECHSPRPFMHKQFKSAPHVEYLDLRSVPYTNDPVQRFEYGNSSPYPVVTRTSLTGNDEFEHRRVPSNELEISILDSTIIPQTKIYQTHQAEHACRFRTMHSNLKPNPLAENTSHNVSNSLENKRTINLPNIFKKNENFFLRRDHINGYNQITSEMNKLQLDKENNPSLKKAQIMMMGQSNTPNKDKDSLSYSNSLKEIDSPCRCHHCIKVCNTQHIEPPRVEIVKNQNINRHSYNMCHCITMLPQTHTHCACNIPTKIPIQNCSCSNTKDIPKQATTNIVDKKTWAIQRYEQNKNTECLDVEKQANIIIDEKEPTVADLFKIIKYQNEQLHLLQAKVDKFISTNTNNGHNNSLPIHNYITEKVALESASADQKISIGVMTSFEVVRTSTIINKEFVKQNEAQIQCNRSQISIKEVVTKQPAYLNFLDGLSPVAKQVDSQQQNKSDNLFSNGDMTNNQYVDDKTLNEMSLYNVQVENAITPNISPDQSLYLDIRDYSDSDASSDDQSNVGWTYYNKVMTHVNGILQESDMPSSASALYRNARQKCMQMQIDKTNVSVAKRVTFGDDPMGLEKPQIQQVAIPTTDTSIKMKQLAAKYLKDGVVLSNIPSPRPAAMPVDMSLATRNYMEKHRILKGENMQPNRPNLDIPKFLDITALKQQSKLC